MKTRSLTIAIVAFSLMLFGCGARRDTIKIGAKSFAENLILARIVSALVEAETGLNARIVECGDSFECARALRMSRVDLMVDYSGTGLIYSGAAVGSDGGALETVRRIYAPWGLLWLDPLGFDNSFRLVASASGAIAFEASTISDLAKLESGVRIAVPGVYLQRPGDGLQALLRHYGLKTAGDPLVVDDPAERLLELRRGRADVAIFNATDGVLHNAAVKILKDDLQFFPKYEAAVVAREELLEERPKLKMALSRLQGQLGTDEMMDLNYKVQVEGWSPLVAAYYFLKERNLGGGVPDELKRKPEILVAVDPRDELGAMAGLAAQAVHKVFPDQPVSLKITKHPVRDLTQGKARLAVLTASKFFRGTEFGLDRFGIRINTIEAAAQLGNQYLHIIGRKGEIDPSKPFEGRVGVAQFRSGSARAAEAILDHFGKRPRVYERLPELLKRLSGKELDVILVFADLKSGAISRALSQGDLILTPLPKLKGKPPVFLHKARIPDGTYPSQGEPVNSMSMQVLLAGPAPDGPSGLSFGGPAAAIESKGTPLTFEQANALAEAVKIQEPPDPALPAVWMRSDSNPEAPPTLSQILTDTILNVLVILFIVWVVSLVVRRAYSQKSGD